MQKIYSYAAEKFFYPHPANKGTILFENNSREINTLQYNKQYIALDLEMSGLNPEKDEIIQLAWIEFHFNEEEFVIDNSIYSDICVKNVSKDILKLTNIKQQDLNKAPKISNILNKLSFDKKPIVGHHVVSDLEFLFLALQKENKQIPKIKFIDSLYLSNEYVKNITNHKLFTLEDYYHIVAKHHNAYDDALSSALIAILTTHKKLNHNKIINLHQLRQQKRLSW